MRLTALILLAVSLLIPAFSQAALTPAGTIISNQATASWRGASGERQSISSNIVRTRVEQLAAVSLLEDQNAVGEAGQLVYLHHQLVNDGNGDDRYDLNALDLGGDDFDALSLRILSDQDRDGIPDSATAISESPWLAAGEVLPLIVEARLPSGRLAGEQMQLQMIAVSQFDPLVQADNTDTVLVSGGGLLRLSKTLSASAGPSPSATALTVTLAYENAGRDALENLWLIDALPEGMSYVPGSARWVGQAGILTDANSVDAHVGTVSSLYYCAYDSSCGALPESDRDTDNDSTNQVSARLERVGQGEAGRIQFDVTIDSGLSAVTLLNQIEAQYEDGNGTIQRIRGNTVRYDIVPSHGVVINGSDATPINGMNEPLTANSAPQGSRLVFDNRVWNTGNHPSRYSIEIGRIASTFPIGTVYRLYREDGRSPLLDDNGDGVPDTVSIEPGSFAHVYLEIELPDGVSGNNGGSGFDVTVEARSHADVRTLDTIVNHLDEIVANTVDLTNNAAAGDAGALGEGPGAEIKPVSLVQIQSGELAEFVLYLRNNSAVADRYRLTAHATSAGAPLPAGWSATFHELGTDRIIHETPDIPSGESIGLRVRVRTPDDVQTRQHSIFFRARSSASGAEDMKHDAIEIISNRLLSVNPSFRGHLEPGGFVSYTHTVENSGNTELVDVQLQATTDVSGWSSVVYLDSNDNAVFDSTDLQQSAALTLAPGESLTFFVRVFAPASAVVGARAITLVQASATGILTPASVTDITTVALTRVAVRKEQAVDLGCDGSPDVGSVFGPGRIEVPPGNNCVIYRLTAINHGSETSFNVTLHDTTPAYTRYRGSASCSRSPCWLEQPSDGETGTIRAETDQLLPGDSFNLEFAVQVE